MEGKMLELDQTKVDQETKHDGYYFIITSELKMSDLEMREIYHGLICIEDTFKDGSRIPADICTNR